MALARRSPRAAAAIGTLRVASHGHCPQAVASAGDWQRAAAATGGGWRRPFRATDRRPGAGIHILISSRDALCYKIFAKY